MGDLRILQAAVRGNIEYLTRRLNREPIPIGVYYLAGLYNVDYTLSFLQWRGILNTTFVSIGAAVAGNAPLFEALFPQDIDDVHWLAAATGGNIEIIRMLISTEKHPSDLELFLITLSRHGHYPALREFIRFITIEPYFAKMLLSNWDTFTFEAQRLNIPVRYALFALTPKDVVETGIMKIVDFSHD